jgi:hypothetical protein
VVRRSLQMARARIELATPRFSVDEAKLSNHAEMPANKPNLDGRPTRKNPEMPSCWSRFGRRVARRLPLGFVAPSRHREAQRLHPRLRALSALWEHLELAEALINLGVRDHFRAEDRASLDEGWPHLPRPAATP